MQTRQPILQGVIPSLVLPLVDGRVYWDSLERELIFLAASGVDAIGLGGGLGELAGINAKEFGAICRFARERVGLPLLVTILPDSEPEAYDLLDAALQAGANAICLAEPHYLFQTSLSDLVSYLGRIRTRFDLPLVLGITSSTAILTLPSLSTLAGEGLIDGIVQGGVDPHLLVDLLAMEGRLPVLCAMEELAYIGLLLGAEGVTSTLAAVFPREMTALLSTTRNRDHATARDIHERLLRMWRTLDHPSETLTRIRLALKLQGRDPGEAHAPFHFADASIAVEVSRSLIQEGVEVNAGL